MKKIIFILLMVFAFSVIIFSTEIENKKIENMVFGINQSDYNALNLSADQIKKIEKLKNDYVNSNKETEQKKANEPTDAEKLSKDLEGYIAKQNKFYDDFKKILDKDQLAKYERAYFIKLSEQKVFLLKKFSAFEEPLSLTDEQKTQYRKFINDYEGNLLKLEQDFLKLLNENQKIIYNHLKQRQMEALIASGKNTQVEKKESNNVNNTSNNNSTSDNTNTSNNNAKNSASNQIVIQPVIWWSFANWNPFPVYRRDVHIYHHYWDIYDREWKEWDYYRWAYEEWKYEEKIYERGFIDGIEYDQRLYEEWAKDPFDEKSHSYIEKSFDNYDYDAYSEIYKDANVGYDLSKYYDEKAEDLNYDKYYKDFKPEDYTPSDYDKNSDNDSYDYETNQDTDYDMGKESDMDFGESYDYEDYSAGNDFGDYDW